MLPASGGGSGDDDDRPTFRSYDWHPEWFFGRLESDYNRLVPNGVDVRVKFVLQKPELFLQTTMRFLGTKWNYRVKQMALYVPVKTMAKDPMNAIEERLKRSSLKYHYRRSTITTFSMPSSAQKWMSENLFPSRLLIPLRLFVMVISEKAYLGHFNYTPYRWDLEPEQGCPIKSVKLTRDGDAVDGMDSESQPVLDFTNFYDVLGQSRTGDTCSISLEQYKRGTYSRARARARNNYAGPAPL